MSATISDLLKELLAYPTFWILLGGFAMSLWMWRSRGVRTPPEMPVTTMARWLSSPWFLVCATCLGVANAAIAIDLCYTAPLDVSQDTASAQLLLRGEPIYRPDMNSLVLDALRNDPAKWSLGTHWHTLRIKEAWENTFTGGPNGWGQAHPPLMTMFYALSVALVGVRGSCLGISVLSLAALGVVLFLLRQAFAPAMQGRMLLAFVAIILGWGPMISLFRQGQSGLVLSALMVLGWWCLRVKREAWAGIAIGVATCLKLYPGLLLVYFLLRHRRAFWAACLTILALVGSSLAVVRWQDYLDYFQTTHMVVARYSSSPMNISVLGFLTRDLGLKESPGFAMLLLSLAGLLLVGSTAWLVHRGTGERPVVRGSLDLEYALFVLPIPLLSPFTWDHYLLILLLPVAILGNRILQTWHWPPICGFFGMLTALSLPIPTRPGSHVAATTLMVIATGVAVATLWLWATKLYRESYLGPRINEIPV
ncbi:MAG TPA: glycosyltransferase family 87 protein [Bryobacteraceae bacterium]|jgi:hypothetical protein